MADGFFVSDKLDAMNAGDTYFFFIETGLLWTRTVLFVPPVGIALG